MYARLYYEILEKFMKSVLDPGSWILGDLRLMIQGFWFIETFSAGCGSSSKLWGRQAVGSVG